MPVPIVQIGAVLLFKEVENKLRQNYQRQKKALDLNKKLFEVSLIPPSRWYLLSNVKG